MKNTLYYGDNLDILRQYIKDESVDLIYLDPPFKSNQNYNVLFEEQNGTRSKAQIKAFEDTWRWDQGAEEAFHEIVTSGGKASEMLQAFRKFLGENDMMAYLVMMTSRLVEMRRVLKPIGSIYLHCDPTASHYLKILMDAIFGHGNFRNEIVWRRTNAKSLAFTRFASNHDIILRYSKSEEWIWNPQYTESDQEYLDKFYRFIEPETGRRYHLADLTNPNENRPNLTYEFLGITRVWRWTKERMKEAYDQGIVVQNKPGTVPRLKRYLDEQKGNPIDDLWTDIKPIQAHGAESLGYPTQKPVALLERIILSSSNKGSVVLDPFCGCGTAISAAQNLKRKWIGIDITHLAISLIRTRLRDTFGERINFDVVGEPKDISGAIALSRQDRYQFQWWALGLVGARPIEEKKGADKGIDGCIYFFDDPKDKKAESIIISVKSGGVTLSQVRDLRGVIERENAAIGVFITLEQPTFKMKTEAASAGIYKSAWGNFPKLQILTIADLFSGKNIECPPLKQVGATFKKAERAKGKAGKQTEIDLIDD